MNQIRVKYDIALSYAKENEDYVDEFAEQLSATGIKVFYDLYEEVNLWGKDLYQHLFDVYSNQARHTIIFISEYYAKKVWTNHELKSAQSRALKENYEYILPARFDLTELPGLSPATAYLDLNKITPVELARIVQLKLKLSEVALASDVNHVGYSYVLIRREFEEKRRNNSLLDKLFKSDGWDYSIPIEVYLDSQLVGKIVNGGELFIETTPGQHSFQAKASYYVWHGDGFGGHTGDTVVAHTKEEIIDLKEGKNIIHLHYRSGHVQKNIETGLPPIYFSI